MCRPDLFHHYKCFLVFSLFVEFYTVLSKMFCQARCCLQMQFLLIYSFAWEIFHLPGSVVGVFYWFVNVSLFIIRVSRRLPGEISVLLSNKDPQSSSEEFTVSIWNMFNIFQSRTHKTIDDALFIFIFFLNKWERTLVSLQPCTLSYLNSTADFQKLEWHHPIHMYCHPWCWAVLPLCGPHAWFRKDH